MKKGDYIETNTNRGVVWKMVKDDVSDEHQDQLQNYTEHDRAWMVIVLLIVVLVNSTVTAALSAGIAYTIMKNAGFPMDYVNSESIFILKGAFAWVFSILVITIMVHGRIGRLIAKG